MSHAIDIDTAIAFWAAELRRDGYCIIPELLPRESVEALDADVADRFASTPFCQGSFYGETTKRFGRLLARSNHAAALVAHELVLGVVDAVLSPWCESLQLNVTQAIAVHPGAPAQLPHRDQDMWQASKGDMEYLVNVIWPLTPFTAENGATRVWPRSHGARALAADIDSSPVPASMSPGSALLFLGSTLHGAGANRSSEIRRGLVVGYALGWLKPYENQWLAYPPPIAKRFPRDLAALVGYRQHRPNLGNFEGQCPSVLLGDYADEPLAATDALRPDQAAMLDAYMHEQARAP